MPSATLQRSRPGDSGIVVAIAATAVATTAPTSETEGIYTADFERVRTLLSYSGTVTACVVKIWVRDQSTGTWYEGATTDEIDPLTPGGASPTNEARDWGVGGQTEVAFQVISIAGGGTVEVRVRGVQT